MTPGNQPSFIFQSNFGQVGSPLCHLPQTSELLAESLSMRGETELAPWMMAETKIDSFQGILTVPRI